MLAKRSYAVVGVGSAAYLGPRNQAVELRGWNRWQTKMLARTAATCSNIWQADTRIYPKIDY